MTIGSENSFFASLRSRHTSSPSALARRTSLAGSIVARRVSARKSAFSTERSIEAVSASSRSAVSRSSRQAARRPSSSRGSSSPTIASRQLSPSRSGVAAAVRCCSWWARSFDKGLRGRLDQPPVAPRAAALARHRSGQAVIADSQGTSPTFRVGGLLKLSSSAFGKGRSSRRTASLPSRYQLPPLSLGGRRSGVEIPARSQVFGPRPAELIALDPHPPAVAARAVHPARHPATTHEVTRNGDHQRRI